VLHFVAVPPKGTSLRGTASFDVLGVKIVLLPIKYISFGVLAVGNSKKPESTLAQKGSEVTHMQKRNRLSDLDEILRCDSYLPHNHPRKI